MLKEKWNSVKKKSLNQPLTHDAMHFTGFIQEKAHTKTITCDFIFSYDYLKMDQQFWVSETTNVILYSSEVKY